MNVCGLKLYPKKKISVTMPKLRKASHYKKNAVDFSRLIADVIEESDKEDKDN